MIINKYKSLQAVNKHAIGHYINLTWNVVYFDWNRHYSIGVPCFGKYRAHNSAALFKSVVSPDICQLDWIKS